MHQLKIKDSTQQDTRCANQRTNTQQDVNQNAKDLHNERGVLFKILKSTLTITRYQTGIRPHSLVL